MQAPRRCHLQAVVVNSQADGAASNRVVAVAQGIRQRLSRRQGWVQRFVDALNVARFEPAAMGRVSRRKRSALERSTKALPLNCRLSRNSVRSIPRKRATRSRHWGKLESFGVAEQDSRCSDGNAVTEQPESAQ